MSGMYLDVYVFIRDVFMHGMHYYACAHMHAHTHTVEVTFCIKLSALQSTTHQDGIFCLASSELVQLFILICSRITSF